MKRKDLEECIALRHEIDAIRKSMESPKSTYVSVFYKDYRTGKGIPKSMRGYDNGEEQLRILNNQLNRRKRRLLRKLDAAEKFIESIDDVELRAILRCYYINGESQMDIGRDMNYSQAAISTKINAFWNLQDEIARQKKARCKPDKSDNESVI